MQCLCLSIDADEWNDRTELLSLCEFGTVPNFEENLRRENHSMRLTVMMRAAEGMNDHHKIRKKTYQLRLRPADTLARHLKSRAFLGGATREAHASQPGVG